MILPISLGFSKANFRNMDYNTQAVKNNYVRSYGLQKDSFEKSKDISPIASNSVSKVSGVTFGYNFYLKELKGIPCAYCGKDVVSGQDLSEIVHLKGDDLAAKLDSYYKQAPLNLSTQARKAYDVVKQTALEFPEKTAEELLPILFVDAHKRLIKKQSKIYDEIEQKADTLNTRSLSKYIKDVRNQDAVLKQNLSLDELSNFLINEQHVQYRKEIIRNISDIRQSPEAIKNNHAKTWDQIISKVDELPSSKTDEDAYLVKFISKSIKKNINDELIPKNLKSSEMFYAQLLYPFLSTAEHIRPFSRAGASKSSNYLVAHSHCNGDRGNIPWIDYMLKKPPRFNHVIENLEAVSSIQKNGSKKSRNFNIPDYLKQVSTTLRTQVRGYKQNHFVDRFLKDLSEIQPPDTELQQLNNKKQKYKSLNKTNISSENINNLKELRGNRLASKLDDYSKSISDIPSVQAAAIEKVSYWAKSHPYMNADELVPVLYDDVTKCIIKNRKGTFSRLLKDSNNEHIYLKKAILKLQKEDPLLKENITNQEIEDFLSNKSQEEYKDKVSHIVDMLYGHTPANDRTAKWYKIVQKMPHTLNPQSKASGELLKMLVKSRNEDGSYDSNKFYMQLLSK